MLSFLSYFLLAFSVLFFLSLSLSFYRFLYALALSFSLALQGIDFCPLSTEVSKEDRNMFVHDDLETIASKFQVGMAYCARDVYNTLQLAEKVRRRRAYCLLVAATATLQLTQILRCSL